MIDRRAFGALALAALIRPRRASAQPAVPPRANAQSAVKARRIGVLTAGGADLVPLSVFDGLRALGWIAGENLVIERRGGDGQRERVAAMAAELVRMRVDVIVTFGAVAGLAAKNATTTIPIVATTGDPVVFGLVSNMAHPGGNITGIALISPQLAGKRLELLRELLPNAVRIGELVDPNNVYWSAVRGDYERAFRALGMEPIFVFVPDSGKLDGALAEIARRRAAALIFRGDPVFESNREQIAQFALKNALPTIAEYRNVVEAGILMSYGPVGAPLLRRRVELIDRILRGANPGDLPIEQPSEFELVINLRTAKALGLAIPAPLLQRADDVIS